MSTQNMQVNTEEIHFKVQYGDEYRRFKLENATFTDLVNRIKATFELSEEDPIALKYKDEEGDAITISTEAEFVFAAELFAGKVLRLSIDLPNSIKCHQGGRGPWAEHHGRGGPWGRHGGRGPWGGPSEELHGRGGPWGEHHGRGPWGAFPGRGGPWVQHHGRGPCGGSSEELHGRGGPWGEHHGRGSWGGRGGRGSWKEHKAEWKMQKKAGKWSEKLQANPEALNKKKQSLEWKVQNLQQRRAYFETGEKRNHPQAAQRVAAISEKIVRVEKRLALLRNLEAVAASSEPAQAPGTPVGTDDMNTAQ